MKMFKADARLYLGNPEDALDIYSSIVEDLERLKKDGARWEYVGDPFHSVRRVVRNGDEKLWQSVRSRPRLVEAILKEN